MLLDEVEDREPRQLAVAHDLGRAFFGAEGFLPAYYERLAPLFSYLAPDDVLVLDDPAAIALAAREDWERAALDEPHRENEPHFPPQAFFIEEPEATLELNRAVDHVIFRKALEGGQGTYSLRLPPGEYTVTFHLEKDALPKTAWGDAPLGGPRLVVK